MKKLIKIILFIGLIPIIYYLLRSIVNIKTIINIYYQFSEDNYILLLSNSLSSLYFFVLLFVLNIHFIFINNIVKSYKKISQNLYKPMTQFIFTLLTIVIAILIFTLFSYDYKTSTMLFSFSFFIIIATIIINLKNLIKNKHK